MGALDIKEDNVAEVRYGLRVPAVHPTDVEGLRAWVVRAEELGFDSIWAGDHVFYNTDVLQPLHLITWIAAQTSRVRLCQAVMLSAYLNPVLLAKAASTIDVLSAGRFMLGMSIGGSEAEYTSIGVPMNQRVGRLLESVDIMRKLWREDGVEFVGRYNTIEKGTINPKPVQTGGVPVWLGAFGEKMLKRAVRVADGWVGGAGAIDRYLELATAASGYCEAAGRDPDTLAIGKLQCVSVDENADVARERALKHWQTYYGPRWDIANTIHGTPAQCAEQLAVFRSVAWPSMTLVMEPSGLGLDQLEAVASITVGTKP
jgi:probable F420-dependent oxidoreductase